MRNFQMKRQRGRNRGGNQSGGKQTQNANRAFDSNGPDGIKVRGHAQHVYEKYQQLARDAASAGDRVLAENYLQHAEHYFRTIRALQPNKPVTEIVGRETFASGFDIDFEDETVVAAIEATDAAALEREQNGGAPAPAEAAEGAEGGQSQPQGGQNPGGQNQGGQNSGGQNRPWEPRPPRSDRYESRDRGGQGDRSQGDRSQGDRSQGDRYQNDRPPRDQQGGGDRPRYESRERDDRQQGGDRPRFDRTRDRDDRYQGERPRWENRDRDDRSERPQGERTQGERTQGERPQGERSERSERPRWENRDRGERAETAGDASSPLVAPATEGARESSGRVLRSEDGGVSQLPGFLASAAPAPAPDGDEVPKPARRRRSSKPKAEGGESSEG